MLSNTSLDLPRLVPSPLRPTSALFPYTTLFRSSMLPRVALEYGHTWCAASTNPRATSASTSPASTPMRSTVRATARPRSEEHTSELQSRENLVCRLLLEKKQLMRNALIDRMV